MHGNTEEFYRVTTLGCAQRGALPLSLLCQLLLLSLRAFEPVRRPLCRPILNAVALAPFCGLRTAAGAWTSGS